MTKTSACALLTALLSPALALAGPSVERSLDELPAALAPDATLVVINDKPGALHWGVDGWRLPGSSLRPPGTRVVNASAVETPFTGPGADGKYRCRLGPFGSAARSVEMVTRNDDGTWGKTGANRDGRVAIRAGALTRRRPITIGRGPVVGRSGQVVHHEDFQDWELADCRGVDAADDPRDLGDRKNASRDLVGFYSRLEGAFLNLRVDLLDMGLGDEQGALDVVVLIDCAPGGQAWLPDFVTGRVANGRWNLAMTVRDAQTATLWDSSWSPVPATGFRAHLRSDLDALEWRISTDALLAAGWDGRRALGFWVYTLKDGDGRVADAFNEARVDDAILDTRTADDRQGGTAKYSVILHGNQAVQPLRWLHDLVRNTRITTPNGNPTGYSRALDAHQIFRAPVNIHVSGTLAGTVEWGAPAFNQRIRGFLDGKPETGEGALMGGVLAEHIMPYFENARSAHGGGGLNAYTVKLNDELLDKIYGGPQRKVFWIPERVVRGQTFRDVTHDARGRRTGYTHSVIDQVTHLTRWYGHADAHGKNGYKLNRVNGVDCFVINDDADQWKFANTDGGLWIWTRRQLASKALDPDQEQLVLVFDDWEAFSGRSFTSFGVGNDNPDNYETNLRWIANHPWIQVVTLEQVASWGWRPVDRGARPNLPIETYDWLKHATEESYDHWYYGSNQEESFSQLRPQRTPGVRIPKAFGEIDRPGGLFHDVWAEVATAPANRLRDLAAAVFAVDVFETAWHDEDMNDYIAKLSNGDYRYPDTTFDRISGWSRAMQNRTGDAAIVAAAARWAAAPPTSARAWRADVDHDGEDEFVVADAKAFYVLENDGGRLVFAAVRDGNRAEPVVCNLLNAPGNESARDREAASEDQVTRAHGLVDWWAGGSQYVNDVYRATQLSNGWRLTSSDGRLQKTLTLFDGKLTASYRADGGLGTVWVRTGLAPAALDLFMGTRLAHERRSDGAVVARANRVEVALVPAGGATINHGATFGGKGAQGVPFAHQVELSGQGSFSFRLEPRLR